MSNKGRYGILAVRKWGEKALFINEAIESEEGAIMEAIRIFRNFGIRRQRKEESIISYLHDNC